MGQFVTRHIDILKIPCFAALFFLLGCDTRSAEFKQNSALLHFKDLKVDLETEYRNAAKNVELPLELQEVAGGKDVVLEIHAKHVAFLLEPVDSGNRYEQMTIVVPGDVNVGQYTIGTNSILLYSRANVAWPKLGCHGFASSGLITIVSVSEGEIKAHIDVIITFPKELWHNKICSDLPINLDVTINGGTILAALVK